MDISDIWTMIPSIVPMAATVLCLDRGHLGLNFVSGLRRLRGEILQLVGDHREASSGLASASRFDRRIEREQVGLRGNGGNQFDSFSDSIGRDGEYVHSLLERGSGRAGSLERFSRRSAPHKPAVLAK